MNNKILGPDTVDPAKLPHYAYKHKMRLVHEVLFLAFPEIAYHDGAEYKVPTATTSDDTIEYEEE